MEPSYSYNNPNAPINQLITLLKDVVHYCPFGEEQDIVNLRMQELCKSILQTSENIPYVDRFFLMRSMHEFTKAGMEGYKEGKASIRECFKKMAECLYGNEPVVLDSWTMGTCLQSYPDYQYCITVLEGFLPLLQQGQTVSQDLFFKLIQMAKLEKSILIQLHEMLKKSGNASNDYLKLISQCINELEIGSNLEMVGLYHKHLNRPSEDDTVFTEDSDTDEEINNFKESDLGKILEILSQEEDGGYCLLQQAEFLSSSYDILDNIHAVKSNFPNIEIEGNHSFSPIKKYLEIEPLDRLDVLSPAMTLCNKWKEIDSRFKWSLCNNYFKCKMLNEINVVPKDQRQEVCNELQTYKIYCYYDSFLSNINRGYVVVYLLLPFKGQLLHNSEITENLYQEMLCLSLWQKLNDSQLPEKTRQGLALFVLQKWKHLGIQMDSDLYQLANNIKIMNGLTENIQSMDLC